MTTCADDLALDTTGRSAVIPENWKLHTHVCFSARGPCDFIGWSLVGEFDVDPDGPGGPLQTFTYRRARTEMVRSRAGIPPDHGTRGSWVEHDAQGNTTGWILVQRVGAIQDLMDDGATYREAVAQVYGQGRGGQ